MLPVAVMEVVEERPLITNESALIPPLNVTASAVEVVPVAVKVYGVPYVNPLTIVLLVVVLAIIADPEEFE
jgi:hypothetical protein